MTSTRNVRAGLTIDQLISRLRVLASRERADSERFGQYNATNVTSAADELVHLTKEVGRWRLLAEDCLTHASELMVDIEDMGHEPATTHVFDMLFTRMRQLAGKHEQIVSTDLMSCKALSSLLGLVLEYPPDATELATWTPKEREAAQTWAGAVHLSASDNDNVTVPSEPERIRTWRAAMPTSDGGIWPFDGSLASPKGPAHGK